MELSTVSLFWRDGHRLLLYIFSIFGAKRGGRSRTKARNLHRNFQQPPIILCDC
jgi:hypothetical protein